MIPQKSPTAKSLPSADHPPAIKTIYARFSNKSKPHQGEQREGEKKMEIKDIVTILSSIAALISAITALIEVVKKRKSKGVLNNALFWIASILTVLFASSTVWLLTRPCVDSSRYGFEEGTMGWVRQVYETDQGVTAIEQSADKAKFCHSLKMTVDLEGGHANKSRGEAYVEINPQNLENKPITVWVYVPREALGDPEKPNGIQVFVKDKDWKGEYGTWWNIGSATADRWQQVTLTPSRSAPPNGYMEPEFDPTQIRVVGVKIAIGEGSTAKYSGPIYIDAVDWP
jgi:hypothetical protein